MHRRSWLSLTAILVAWAASAPAFAEDVLSPGDTAWMLTSSALVLMMTLPGLALFYGGLVRGRNVLSVLMQCLVAGGMAGVVWVVIGYSLAFGDGNAFVGGLDKVMLGHATPETLNGTIPEYVFIVFQGMFAIITPALMLGAFAERMKFSAYLVFITLWLLIVYCPLAHMVWGGGLISGWGALDFAGGLVVHMSSGFSALVACIILGPRLGYGKEPAAPHNLPYTVIGASLLWVGWFGFNAGSELAADGTAGLAFLTTNTAAAAAVLTWCGIERVLLGKPTVLGAATGAVAGLVAITPACAFVTPGGAIGIGIGAGALCYFFVAVVKKKFGYDDSLDVFGVHGIGGTWGAIAVALFLADFAMTDAGRMGQLWIQLKSIGFTAIFAPAATAAILYGMKAVMTLRADPEEETDGLDYALHGETAYTSGGGEH
jgi:Amt family ammonium transporter